MLAVLLTSVAAALGADPAVLVLGVAQDGGAPQAGCHRACCVDLRADPAKRLHVACLAIVDPDTRQRWLIDATPQATPAGSRFTGAAGQAGREDSIAKTGCLSD